MVKIEYSYEAVSLSEKDLIKESGDLSHSKGCEKIIGSHQENRLCLLSIDA